MQKMISLNPAFFKYCKALGNIVTNRRWPGEAYESAGRRFESSWARHSTIAYED
jgi:hypothetical protein